MQIEMSNINKSFASVRVLENAAIKINEGEVHALMGENGAGKSTLMKILTGVYRADSGQILLDGQPVSFNHPREAEKAGIVFIHQENNTIPDLTVVENMFIGKELTKSFGRIDKKNMILQCERIFSRLGSNISVHSLISELSVGQQQLVEIAKALLVEAKVVIMDEPTAALSSKEADNLFRVIQQLKESCVSVVYISHRMEEIFKICDRVSVLRDGQFIGTKKVNDTDQQELVRMMIGREIGDQYPKRLNKIGEVKLSVESFSCSRLFKDISFEVRKGEVLGVYGLIGAGRTEIMHGIFGNLPSVQGRLFIDGQLVSVKNPRIAKQHKIGFITEDRKSEGLILDDTIARNISLNNIPDVTNYGFILNKNKEKKLVNSYIDKLNIRCRDAKQHCIELSGGNQQKIVFAKWIANRPEILILDEPTRGIDIGAKKEIYNLINKMASDGTATIFISSDMPEILGMSDRIMVVREGKVAGFIDSAEASQEKVMMLAAGGTV